MKRTLSTLGPLLYAVAAIALYAALCGLAGLDGSPIEITSEVHSGELLRVF